MAEKYYNKKPPEFGIPEYSGGLIFVPEFAVFFSLNLVASLRSDMPQGISGPGYGRFMFFREN
jgi:hypothetical protein